MAFRRALGTGLLSLARQTVAKNAQVTAAAATEAPCAYKNMPSMAQMSRGFAAEPAAAAISEGDGTITQASNFLMATCSSPLDPFQPWQIVWVLSH
jgi:hypothetical protein